MHQAPLEPADLREHDPLTVGAYLTSWLDHTRGRVRAKTHDGYQAQIRLYALPRLDGVLLVDLHPLLLQGLYGDLLAKGLSGGTVLNLHLVLTQALAQAARWGLIPTNPAAGAQPPRPRRPEIAVVDPSPGLWVRRYNRGGRGHRRTRPHPSDDHRTSTGRRHHLRRGLGDRSDADRQAGHDAGPGRWPDRRPVLDRGGKWTSKRSCSATLAAATRRQPAMNFG
jgi:hypothetical protein